MLSIPGLNQWNVKSASGTTRPKIEGSGCPEKTDTVGRVVRVQGCIGHKGSVVFRKAKFPLVIFKARDVSLWNLYSVTL